MKLGIRTASLQFLLAIIVVLASATSVLGAEVGSDESDRIRTLEAENAAIRDELDVQRARLDALVDEQALPAESTQQAETPPVDAKDGFFSIQGKFPMSISGFIKGDMLWNSSRLNSTSAPRFVMSESGGKGSDDQFTATVQHTRIIGKIGDIEVGEDAKLRVHAEVDLFNLADTTDTNFNNNQLRVRQLYTELDVASWTILMGQAWDVFSPLNVSSLNTNGNHWFGGNAGFRRPQVRVSKNFAPADGHKMSLVGSVNANIGVTVTDGGRTLNSGRDAGIPVLEGRFDYTFPGWAGPIRVGTSGLWGEEDIDGVENGVAQWAVGVHTVVPLHDRVTLSGEYHHGVNTDAFLFGGGVNVATGETIESDSAWLQLAAKATDQITVTAIAGFDDPENDDLAAGGRSFNRLAGGSVKYQAFKHLTLGVEYQNFATKYKGGSSESSNLIWTSAILTF